ncbi:unnamed protein product, partial [marine sediment metagenome]
EAVDGISDNEKIAIDFSAGKILAGEKVFSFPALPDSVIGILEAGGLIPYTKKKLKGDI